MPISFDTSEVRKLAADMDTGRKRVGRDSSQAIRKAGRDLVKAAKRNAPRRTGALAESISAEVHGTGNSANFSVVAGPTLLYGLFQERGTSRMAPHPFMGPALDEVAPGLQEDLAEIASEVLDE